MGTRSSASKPGGRGYERGHRECQREDESMEKNLAVDVRPLHVATVRSLVEPTPRGREGNARRPRDFKRCIGPKKVRPQRAEGFHEVAHQRARDTWGLGLGLVRRSLSSGPCLGQIRRVAPRQRRRPRGLEKLAPSYRFLWTRLGARQASHLQARRQHALGARYRLLLPRWRAAGLATPPRARALLRGRIRGSEFSVVKTSDESSKICPTKSCSQDCARSPAKATGSWRVFWPIWARSNSDGSISNRPARPSSTSAFADSA